MHWSQSRFILTKNDLAKYRLYANVFTQSSHTVFLDISYYLLLAEFPLPVFIAIFSFCATLSVMETQLVGFLKYKETQT